MGINSKIEWTDHTVNLWHGCTKVHAGCANCYAETQSRRFGRDLWGDDKPRLGVLSAFPTLDSIQRKLNGSRKMERVFVGSMMDIFEKPKETISEKGGSINRSTGMLRNELFESIQAGTMDNIMFLFLTKRPSNIRKYIPDEWKRNPPPNVMFGTSPVDQLTFDTLVKQLLDVPGKKFLSVEPQLDMIKIGALSGIDWIIQGGESGPKKRPFNLDWAKSMRDECAARGIPYFFKQIDKVTPIPDDLLIRQTPFQS